MNPSEMKKGITPLAFIPVREEPGHASEMKSQLLFGEIFEVLETGPDNWILIQNEYDGYRGWIIHHPSWILGGESAETLSGSKIHITNEWLTLLKKMSDGETIFIPAGSTLYLDPKDSMRAFCGDWYELENACRTLSGDHARDLQTLAAEFLNIPYLWGGKSSFGTDCSGLVQTLFRIMGIRCGRDTSEQHREGYTVNLLAESKPGDLVFFDDTQGEINHVGVLLDPGNIFHAAGSARIDPIDHQGIYDVSGNTYSHKLRLIKRIF